MNEPLPPAFTDEQLRQLRRVIREAIREAARDLSEALTLGPEGLAAGKAAERATWQGPFFDEPMADVELPKSNNRSLTR